MTLHSFVTLQQDLITDICGLNGVKMRYAIPKENQSLLMVTFNYSYVKYMILVYTNNIHLCHDKVLAILGLDFYYSSYKGNLCADFI